MADNNATQADYDSVLAKLTKFAATLTPGEQFAFASVLRNGTGGHESLTGDAWSGLLGVVSTNSADISNKR